MATVLLKFTQLLCATPPLPFVLIGIRLLKVLFVARSDIPSH